MPGRWARSPARSRICAGPATARALIALAADRGLDAGATEGAMRLSWGDIEDPAVTDPRQARRRLYRIDAASGATAEIGPADLTVWEFDLLGDQAALALVSADPSERGWYRARLARLDLAQPDRRDPP